MKFMEGVYAIRRYFLAGGLPTSGLDGARIIIEFPDANSLCHAEAILMSEDYWKTTMDRLTPTIQRLRLLGIDVSLRIRCKNEE